MAHVEHKIADPIGDALKAYGIDPKVTPRDIVIEWSPRGITIDQMILDAAGYPIVDDSRDGFHTPHVATMRKFFRHPAASERWTTITTRLDDSPEHRTATRVMSDDSPVHCDSMPLDEAMREFGIA